MPLTRFVTDALGVVTICLVAILALLGLFCIVYAFYFRNQILNCGHNQLNYFNGPWIVRVGYILFSVWWGIGEIVRLNLFRHKGGILDAFSSRWQENICKCYIISNLGLAEPCLFLTLIFLLRASLQQLGPLSRNWNPRTIGLVLLCCFPVFVFQIAVISIGPTYKDEHMPGLPSYFIRSSDKNGSGIALCTYPLLSTIFLGLFATVLTGYLFWLGTRILRLVINKDLQRRVYTLIFSISSIFPLRIVLLGLSVLTKPERAAFNAIVFFAFLSFLCCAGIGICILVYFPIADSLALRTLQMDIEASRGDRHDSTSSLIRNQSPGPSMVEESMGPSMMEESTLTMTISSAEGSPSRGSISFRALKGKEHESGPAFVELGMFNPSESSSPPGSPRPIGWPMILPHGHPGQGHSGAPRIL